MKLLALESLIRNADRKLVRTMNRREPKKSEMLEVRLAREVKQALMRKAQSEGRSASEIVRESIDAYLLRPKEKHTMLMSICKPAGAVATGAVAVWLALASAPAAAGPDLKAAFEKFDSDGNGAISQQEFHDGLANDRMTISAPNDTLMEAPVMLPVRKDAPMPDDRAAEPQLREMLSREFAGQDADGNGSVNFTEFESFHTQMMAAAFRSVDRNGNGEVEAPELAAVTQQLPATAPVLSLAELDSNGNGKISHDEFFADRGCTSIPGIVPGDSLPQC